MSGGGIHSDEGSQNFVLDHGKRLGEKISHVPNTGNVLDPELTTLDPVLKPVEAHVARLRHLGLDDPVGKAHGDFIIAMNRRGRLRVAEVRENLALVVRDLCSGKGAPILRFLNGRTHHRDTHGVNGDGGVEEGGVVAAREMVERPGHAASVGPGQIRVSVRTSRVMVEGRKIFMPLGCAKTNPRRRSRSAMVASVAVVCALASAQVAVRTRPSTHRP
jgi:hypothetical protein